MGRMAGLRPHPGRDARVHLPVKVMPTTMTLGHLQPFCVFLMCAQMALLDEQVPCNPEQHIQIAALACTHGHEAYMHGTAMHMRKEAAGAQKHTGPARNPLDQL